MVATAGFKDFKDRDRENMPVAHMHEVSLRPPAATEAKPVMCLCPGIRLRQDGVITLTKHVHVFLHVIHVMCAVCRLLHFIKAWMPGKMVNPVEHVLIRGNDQSDEPELHVLALQRHPLPAVVTIVVSY